MVKLDRFTKVLLVVITIFLGMIALKPIFHTEIAQANPGQFDNVDFEIVAGAMGGVGGVFFDRSTGQVWVYDLDSGRLGGVLKLTTLGQPMQTE